MNLVVAFLAILAGFSFPAQAQPASAVLARMDQQAASFHAMTAHLKKATFTAVLNDTTTESGKLWMKRNGRDVEMRTEITEPEPRAIGLAGTTGQIYYPKINTVQIYDLSKDRTLVDQFLLLGFGSSGKELAKTYSITASGQETINGQPADRLELTPKSQKVAEQIKQVALWIPVNAGYPVQQKVLQPGGDYYLVSYSDIQINPSAPDSEFRLKLPANVKKEFPQK